MRAAQLKGEEKADRSAAAANAEEERAQQQQLPIRVTQASSVLNISVSDTSRPQSSLHVVVATFHLKDPSLADEILNFLHHGLDVTRGFKGCRLVEVSVSEDKKAIILYQKWASRAAYDVYMQFRREEGALGPIMAKCCAVPPITVAHAELSSM